eukprot:CAMPEP_0175865478 /NCGR_PEP_ID=MMETSP0107_2-20121207/33673_1 /TAXON_ID=195067 ORGANISM="Goniomonas pacifica, Strain CCMP1869" /NCGR_SAMPLE_ID=MMETSP0107_2 /ASSEMBLY_ACC=CAM_ASM_000203 /LENGTH=60 /DNA_ID=CAMNT_0017182893 /DNA_START=142 /DNA_END=324 /DNA_ORIENTATION=+
MTKPEIKMWMQELYGLPVEKVNTLQMEGRRKRFPGTWKTYTRNDYKVAYVILEEDADQFM